MDTVFKRKFFSGQNLGSCMLKYVSRFFLTMGILLLTLLGFRIVFTVTEEHGLYPLILGLCIYAYFRFKSSTLFEPLLSAILVIVIAPPLLAHLSNLTPGFIARSFLGTPHPTTEVVNHSRQCITDPLNTGQICTFRIGKSLALEITGVGTTIASPYIKMSRPAHRSDYWVEFSVSDPCIRVHAGKETIKRVSADDRERFYIEDGSAWISPLNALAYSSYEGCIQGLHGGQPNHVNFKI